MATAPSARTLCAIEPSKPDKQPKYLELIGSIKTENYKLVIFRQAFQMGFAENSFSKRRTLKGLAKL